MKNVALLILRLSVGILMAGHGAQKVFGWFKGPGMKGTSGFMETLGIKPGGFWGPVAAFGEFSGGVLTALGLLFPVGPQNIMSAMATATRRVHWKLPLWAGQGGAELPLTNFSVALALAILGPGKFSLDRAFGIRLPRWLVALTWFNHIAVTSVAIFRPHLVDEIRKNFQQEPVAYNPPSEVYERRTDPGGIETETRPRTQQPSKERAASNV